jgi:hypothetical protein
MELVQSWVVAVAGELDFELQFIIPHRQIAHRAGGADAWTAPGAIRPPGWEFSGANYCPGFLAEDCFVRHLDVSEHATSRETSGRAVLASQGGTVQMPGGQTPGCVNHKARWKVESR